MHTAVQMVGARVPRLRASGSAPHRSHTRWCAHLIAPLAVKCRCELAGWQCIADVWGGSTDLEGVEQTLPLFVLNPTSHLRIVWDSLIALCLM